MVKLFTRSPAMSPISNPGTRQISGLSRMASMPSESIRSERMTMPQEVSSFGIPPEPRMTYQNSRRSSPETSSKKSASESRRTQSSLRKSTEPSSRRTTGEPGSRKSTMGDSATSEPSTRRTGEPGSRKTTMGDSATSEPSTRRTTGDPGSRKTTMGDSATSEPSTRRTTGDPGSRKTTMAESATFEPSTRRTTGDPGTRKTTMAESATFEPSTRRTTLEAGTRKTTFADATTSEPSTRRTTGQDTESKKSTITEGSPRDSVLSESTRRSLAEARQRRTITIRDTFSEDAHTQARGDSEGDSEVQETQDSFSGRVSPTRSTEMSSRQSRPTGTSRSTKERRSTPPTTRSSDAEGQPTEEPSMSESTDTMRGESRSVATRKATAYPFDIRISSTDTNKSSKGSIMKKDSCGECTGVRSECPSMQGSFIESMPGGPSQNLSYASPHISAVAEQFVQELEDEAESHFEPMNQNPESYRSTIASSRKPTYEQSTSFQRGASIKTDTTSQTIESVLSPSKKKGHLFQKRNKIDPLHIVGAEDAESSDYFEPPSDEPRLTSDDLVSERRSEEICPTCNRPRSESGQSVFQYYNIYRDKRGQVYCETCAAPNTVKVVHKLLNSQKRLKCVGCSKHINYKSVQSRDSPSQSESGDACPTCGRP